MNPNLLVEFLLLSSIVLFSLERLVIADTPKKEDCEPKSCGNVTDISYPFWLEGQHPSYCGCPVFQLSCDDGIPVLQQNKDFQVREIFYNNQSILLADSTLANTDCPVPDFNFSFTLSPLTLSPANKNLSFYDCVVKSTGSYEVTCASTETVAYLDRDPADPGLLNLPSGCRTTVVPVLGYAGANSSDYKALLERGFLLEWTAPDCSECRESNGQCGYDTTHERFMCICSDRPHLKSCTERNSKKNTAAIGAGVGAGAGGILVAGVLGFLLYRRRKAKRLSTSPTLLAAAAPFEPPLKKGPKDPELGSHTQYFTHVFTYEELVEATDGFSSSKELGDGGYGTVYKGKLRDGRIVAVKRLYENNYRRVEQFMNEVDILSRLRHQNLVTLYGCTSRHSRELLLVYEYVANGTVADHLHGDRANEGVLTWPIRMRIAVETADALAYLHAVEPQIIHRDVKTNNILLDNSFHVKVADFGMSRLFPLQATHVSTAPQGTPGYVDPEYYQCYQLTDKSDVYSFGVVLVELISSKMAVDIGRQRNEVNLASLAINKIQNHELDQLVDPGLGYESDGEVKRMITVVAELAFRCLQNEREMRPCMEEILDILRGAESGVYKPGKGDEANVLTKDDVQLLKNVAPYSPDTVTERWASRSTTPNTSA